MIFQTVIAAVIVIRVPRIGLAIGIMIFQMWNSPAPSILAAHALGGAGF